MLKDTDVKSPEKEQTNTRSTGESMEPNQNHIMVKTVQKPKNDEASNVHLEGSANKKKQEPTFPNNSFSKHGDHDPLEEKLDIIQSAWDRNGKLPP